MKLRYVLLSLLAVAAGCSKVEEQEPSPSFVPARILSVYLAMLEKPSATRCLVVGSRGEAYREFFERAGLKVDNLDTADGRYDIVFSAGATRERPGAVAGRMLSGNGVFARVLDVRKRKTGDLGAELEELGQMAPDAHLWMPGLEDWLWTGRTAPAKVKLSAMTEIFSREGGFDDLSAAECESLPELFASYVGTQQEVMPAFAGLDPEGEMKAQFLVMKEIPAIDWIDVDDSVDGEIMDVIAKESRSMQVVRRTVLEGNILADEQKIDEATEAWARAALRNPHDPMLIDRLERLWKNADAFFRVGNFNLAAKCYETYLMIRPDDWQSAEALAFCLNQLGDRELAAKIHERAMRLRDGD